MFHFVSLCGMIYTTNAFKELLNMDDKKKTADARPDSDQKLDKIKNVDNITDNSLLLSGRIQEIRKGKGLTQEEAASGLNMKLNTYRKLEQGVNRKDAAEFINRIADYYEVTADYLLGRELTEPLNFDTVTARTGLNTRSIQQLVGFHLQDGAEPSPGYMDFINCFLGNGECTGLFFQALMPLLDSLYKYEHTDKRSPHMASTISKQLADLIYDYVDKVVVPTYGQLRKTGDYKSPSAKDYLAEDS